MTLERIDIGECSVHCSLFTVGKEDPGLLGERERDMLHSLSLNRRKSEWFAGRMAAKEAVISVLPDDNLTNPDVQILSLPSRAPRLVLRGMERDDVLLSITHSREVALSAAAHGGLLGLGVDAEMIEPRDPSFGRAAFTPRERERMEALRPGDTAVASTVKFTGKEAVSKALGTGLSVNTYDIEVLGPEDEGPMEGGWDRSGSVILHNEAERRLAELGGKGILVRSFMLPGNEFFMDSGTGLKNRYAVSLSVIL